MMSRMVIGVVLVSGLAGAGEGSPAVSDMRGWEIVVAGDAIPSERYAAEEFRRLFGEATGLELRITEQPKGRGRIWIGPGAAMGESRLGFEVEGYGEEESRLRVGRRSIVIAGGRPRGTLYGVYRFAEEFLGVRFLTAEHTHVPRNPDLRIPYADSRHAPDFAYRWSYCREASEHPEFAARLRLNTLTPEERLGGVTRERMESHTFHYQVPVARYGAEHPEYFAWVDGERLLDAPGGGPQLCSMNPAVVEAVTAAVFEELAGRPGAVNVSVCTNDNPYYCQCPACEAVNAREGSPSGAHLALVNAVAERVERRHPGVKVTTLAYNYTRKPPRNLRPRGNVQVWFCPFEACAVHRLDDAACPRNREIFADLRGWRDICSDMRLWYYNTNLRTLDLPYPNLRVLGPNLRLARDLGVGGVFAQGNNLCPAGEFADLRNYVTSRLLWEPDLDAEALIDEFLRLHYGAAGEPIRAAIDLVHDAALESGAHPYCWAEPSRSGIGREAAAGLLRLFEEALARAPDDAVRGRVEKASLGAYKAQFETQGRLEYSGGIVRLAYPAGVEALVPRYRDLCERHGMTYDSEFGSRDDFLGSLRAMAAGAPAVRLEDADWRLTLLRDSGEIVQLLHKPTGREVLEAWERPNVGLRSGTWGEGGPGPGVFECGTDGASAVLTRRLEDGSLVRRAVKLRDGALEFETSVRHRGAEPRVYGLSAGGRLGLAEVVLEPGCVVAREPGASFGLHISFDSGQFADTSADASPEWADVEVELATPRFRLERGGLWTGRYRIEATR